MFYNFTHIGGSETLSGLIPFQAYLLHLITSENSIQAESRKQKLFLIYIE